MKKALSMVLVLAMVLSILAGCTQAPAVTTAQTTPELTPAPTPDETPAPTPDETPAPETTPEETVPATPGDEIPEGYNRLVFYWNGSDDLSKCDIWIWYADVAGKGYLFESCEYGGKVTVDVPDGIEEVGYIVRKNCSEPGGTSWGSATKDYDGDLFAKVDGKENEYYLRPGDPNQYSSNDGGKTLTMNKKFNLAGIVDRNRIRYQITPAATISDLSEIKLYEGDQEIAIAKLSTLGKEASSGYIEIDRDFDLSKIYRIVLEGYGEKPVTPTDIFDTDFFAQTYHYDGKDLGAVISGENTTFKVWAPTASKVVLNLFTAGDGVEAYKTVDMVLGEKGVWAHTEACGHGTYYTYTVTTSVGTQEAVDPYAKAAGVNGNRGMVVDLSKTDPEGWAGAKLENPIESYSDAVIWEVHVRDFSNKIASSQYQGKYLAFTEKGLTNEHGQAVGIDYLKNLGITHVHLLPVYDYATVDEANPDSAFNWGYDPKNYNVPEGSYSTDPFNGEVRIREYKQMVQALHEAGIGVVMDVVYNHTYDANSSFNKIVPYYYYRYNANGTNSSASGCGNDTASERYMFGKFMVESTEYWVSEYKLDGLRFDLMGLHDLQTMQEVEAAVHTVNPNAIIYGEGWTMGATIDGSKQANQGNISGIKPTGDAIGAVAVFNDAMRDGLKGSVFDKASKGYINGASRGNLNKVIFGIQGGMVAGNGWRVEDAMVVNYMSAHDNNTLWDKLLLSNPGNSDEQRNRMNKLGAAILLTSKGTPFWQAGEEMLRTKGGDENSYKSSDEVNNIDWSVLQEGTMQYETMRYYQGLIAVRRSYDIFTDSSVTIVAEEIPRGILVVTYDDGKGGQALVLINPHNTSLPYVLEGNWNLVADETRAGEVFAQETGSVNVNGIGVRIYVNDQLAK